MSNYAQEYYYVVQPYLKLNVLGVFNDLQRAQNAIEKYEHANGFYVKWDKKNAVIFAEHFDGAIMYIISPFPRNELMTEEQLEELKNE